MKVNVRQQLFRKLKEENCFWSYDISKMKSISDEALIEHVMLYLDIDDINKLFSLFGYKKVKRVWLDRVAPQGEMFRPFNILYAWYYFGAKRPEAYVKSIETRHINRLMAAWYGVREIFRNEKPEVAWPAIKKELESVGEIRDYEVGSFDFVSFNFEGVNLSFYAAPRKAIPSMQRIPYLNNMYIADMESIGAMKMEAMLRRSKFRDYYDIYSILKEGKDIQKMIDAALEHSDHKLRTRGLLAMLTNGSRFNKEKSFEELLPVYYVTPYDIQEYIKQKLLEKRNI